MALKKISDKIFWNTMAKCNGVYLDVIKNLKKDYGVTLQYATVVKKAVANKKKLAEVREVTIDLVEIDLLAITKCKQPAVALKAIQYFLDHKARHRGYGAELADNTNTVLTGIKLVTAKKP